MEAVCVPNAVLEGRLLLEALLDKYADSGIEQIEYINVLKVQPINKFGTPVEIINMFGGCDKFTSAIKDLETALYVA